MLLLTLLIVFIFINALIGNNSVRRISEGTFIFILIDFDGGGEDGSLIILIRQKEDLWAQHEVFVWENWGRT